MHACVLANQSFNYKPSPFNPTQTRSRVVHGEPELDRQIYKQCRNGSTEPAKRAKVGGGGPRALTSTGLDMINKSRVLLSMCNNPAGTLSLHQFPTCSHCISLRSRRTRLALLSCHCREVHGRQQAGLCSMFLPCACESIDSGQQWV